jgi:hypothetical protein
MSESEFGKSPNGYPTNTRTVKEMHETLYHFHDKEFPALRDSTVSIQSKCSSGRAISAVQTPIPRHPPAFQQRSDQATEVLVLWRLLAVR